MCSLFSYCLQNLIFSTLGRRKQEYQKESEQGKITNKKPCFEKLVSGCFLAEPLVTPAQEAMKRPPSITK